MAEKQIEPWMKFRIDLERTGPGLWLARVFAAAGIETRYQWQVLAELGGPLAEVVSDAKFAVREEMRKRASEADA